MNDPVIAEPVFVETAIRRLGGLFKMLSCLAGKMIVFHRHSK